MKFKRSRTPLLLALAILTVAIAAARMKADSGSCGGSTITLPFSDVMNSPFFCQIAEAYFSGLTNGTTAGSYSPSANVPREQMAAFVTRTMDQALKRGSRRAVLDQFWTPHNADGLDIITLGTTPLLMTFDGADLWVAYNSHVARVRASDGKRLDDWSAFGANAMLAAMGKIFVGGAGSPANFYEIDPTQPSGSVAALTELPTPVQQLAFDGQRIWTANSALSGTGGSVSIVTINPLNVTTIFTGFTSPNGLLFDGANVWVTDNGDNKLKKLDSSGNILQSVSVGNGPDYPAFDGTNIWVPNDAEGNGTISVVRATGALSGTVLATLSGNGLSAPIEAAFDGERILVTNAAAGVSMWGASDLTPLGACDIGANTSPYGACSDGLHFWVTLHNAGKLVRF